MSAKQKENYKPGIIFYVSTVVVSLFVLWGLIFPTSLSNVADRALAWMITNFGWFYMLITAFFVLFIIVLAISPFGKIRLGDRKSTRLNSSHVASSYAVFCLKKKTIA